MAAQNGSTVLLDYGNQGAQQLGTAVTLSYDAPKATGSHPIGLQTRAPWNKSRGKLRSLDARHVPTERLNLGPLAPWVKAVGKLAQATSPWVVTRKQDNGRYAAWGKFANRLAGDRAVMWANAKPGDDMRASAWLAYGEMLNEDRYGVWKGSKATDALRKSPWRNHLIAQYTTIPYPRPNGLAAHFSVVGGSPMEITLVNSTANQYLPLVVEFGMELYTPHYLGDPVRQYIPPPYNRADFYPDVGKVRLPRLDENGNQIYIPAARDSVKLNPWGTPRKVDDTTMFPWLRFSRPLNPGWGIVVPGGPLAPPIGGTITIPVQRTYIMVNEVLLTRVSDDYQIPATSLNIAFDCDSWLPTFSANIPEAARDAVMPAPNPVEVYAYINGSEFRFFVEKVTRNRQFAQRSVSISGRGVACELDAPFAVASQHTNTSDMTAQQLIDAALGYTGYTQTWNITDWLVPAGAFSMFGTPAAVAGAVAAASGSVLQADWAARDLRMLPRYPVKPWDWAGATPEYVIPADLAQTESIEWLEKPDYNVVYVSGTQQGVVGQVKLTGSAGDKPAPMVTDALITHADAARQRGISILSDTGRKTMMQISMPVLSTVGVIGVCRLIEFSDGANTRRGIVRANNVSAAWPTVRQTLTVEAAV